MQQPPAVPDVDPHYSQNCFPVTPRTYTTDLTCHDPQTSRVKHRPCCATHSTLASSRHCTTVLLCSCCPRFARCFRQCPHPENDQRGGLPQQTITRRTPHPARHHVTCRPADQQPPIQSPELWFYGMGWDGLELLVCESRPEA